MLRIDYTKLINKVRDFGVMPFFYKTGIGGSPLFIYRIEEGGDISLKSLNRCCKFFNCQINDLIEVKYD